MVDYPELQTSEGRLDTVCVGHKAVYVFEFKLDETAEAALDQIKLKGYAFEARVQLFGRTPKGA